MKMKRLTKTLHVSYGLQENTCIFFFSATSIDDEYKQFQSVIS